MATCTTAQALGATFPMLALPSAIPSGGINSGNAGFVSVVIAVSSAMLPAAEDPEVASGKSSCLILSAGSEA